MKIADRKLFLNADKTRVVEEDDPDAAFLLAAEGGEIPEEYRRLPGVKREEPEEDTSEPDTKAITAPPANKALQPDGDKGRVVGKTGK